MQGPAAQVHEGTGAPAPEGGAGGLPQFDIAMWPGQMAWFLIFFVIVLILMARVFVPRIGGTIADREAKISGEIAEARRLKNEADAQVAAADAETSRARAQAMKLGADARAKAQADIAARLAQEEAKLAEAGAVAEARIARARDSAMAHVEEIATDSARAIVERLTGRPASAAEMKAAQAVEG